MVCVEGMLATPTCVGSTTPLQRWYYDRAQAQTENDASPRAFFSSFGTKNRHAQKVPKELHQSNAQAVSDAEMVNRMFLCYLGIALAVLLYYLWYFLYAEDGLMGGTFSRPEGYGVCSAPPRQYTRMTRPEEIPKE